MTTIMKLYRSHRYLITTVIEECEYKSLGVVDEFGNIIIVGM